MAESIVQMEVATVKLGHLEFEGLMSKTGDFAIASRQASGLFQVLPNSTQKWLETNLGKGYSHYQVKTNREGVEGKRVRSSESALALTQFEKLILRLAIKGNDFAIALLEMLLGLSLTQIFSDAFKVKFDAEERQQWAKNRQDNKDSFWLYADAIDTYLAQNEVSVNKHKFLHSNCQNAINRGLFGKDAKTIREELGVSDLLRDHYNSAAIKNIELIQRLACSFITAGKEPHESTREALAMFNLPVVEYQNKGAQN